MNCYCDTTLSIVVVILSVLYLAFQVYRKRWSAVVSFIVILVALCAVQGFTNMSMQMCCVCALLAIVGSNVVALPQTVDNHSSVESFESGKETIEVDKEKTNKKKKRKSDDDKHHDKQHHDKHHKHDNKNDDQHDNKHHDKHDKRHDKHHDKNGVQHHKKHHAKGKDTEPLEPLDNFTTFMETYKSLTPDQIETMTSDTQDLISTQQALMETVKSMAPVISQGKEMMDTFKDYFGPGSTSDLLSAFKPQH